MEIVVATLDRIKRAENECITTNKQAQENRQIYKL